MSRAVVVIGAGIAGIQASVDLAELGFKVYLVEKTSSIGGRMAQLDKTFPTNDCSMCILSPKMIDCSRHENIRLYIYSEVLGIEGTVGDFQVRIRRNPTFVDHEHCTGCGDCVTACPVKVPSEFNLGLDNRKAIYLRFPQAVPKKMVIDSENCLFLTRGRCRACEKVCRAKAIDFTQEAEIEQKRVAAVVLATGFEPYDVTMLEEYGYGRVPNVITAPEFERLISASGPTEGELIRMSDGKRPESLAFIQCVGSRDHRNKLYCSSICCMYASKEAVLAREHDGNIEATIFYTDLRAGGKKFQSYIERARDEYGVRYVRGRPGRIEKHEESENPTIVYEDTVTRKVEEAEVDMAVLCPALVPTQSDYIAQKLGVALDDFQFIHIPDRIFQPFDTEIPGIFACGFCQSPQDIPTSVAQASGAAARVAEVVASTL
jgi:heterodisulfide reductase subunit A